MKKMNTVVKKAAWVLPFYLCVTPSWADEQPQAAQEVENPMQIEAFQDEDEVAPAAALSEWFVEPSEPGEDAALTINEPMYFVAGGNANGRGDLKARFQISFKYQMFSDEGVFVEFLPMLKNFHLGYTQTSLWNLSADSKPFEDTNYRPSFFWEFDTPQFGWKPDFMRIGYEHESNGQAGATSRSTDTLFIQPAWAWRFGPRTLAIAPKVSMYVNKGDENQDINNYRGNTELAIRYGDEDGFLTSLTGRYGFEDHGSVQLDFSYPLRRKIFSRAGGYFYLQVFHGYGESLLTYDQKENVRVRFGFAIVR